VEFSFPSRVLAPAVNAMMQSFLLVTHQQGLVEELHRQMGDDFSLIPLKSVATLNEGSSEERVAAVVIRLPDATPAEPVPQPSLLPAAASLEPMTLEARVDVMEQRIIEDCLRRNHQSRKDTAAELGISRVTLYNKMKKFGLL